MQLKKTVLVLCIGLFFNNLAMASTKCFMAVEGDYVITKQGDCKSRYAPCSTFKIAISLMAYNEGLLVDETHPEWSYKDGSVDWLNR